MKRTPILIMCIGGQGASVLSRSFHACGMSIGNENTFWQPNFLFPHGEHSYVTSIMAQIYTQPKEIWQPRLREVLRSYKTEAEKEDWRFYGIKTSSGICNPKWDAGEVGTLLKEEWPDAQYFGVIRKVNLGNPNAHDAWNSVWAGRKGMVERGGIFVPFPEAWQDGSIKELIETLGLTWTDEVYSIFEEPAEEGKAPLFSPEEFDNYFNQHPSEKEQREYLISQSKKNFERLKLHPKRKRQV